MRFALGAIPSPHDPRDYPVGQFNPTAAPHLARTWDFSALLQPVRNQGGEPTCVGHALTGVMGYQQMTADGDREVLSPRDAYEGARMIELPPGAAGGSYPRAALKYAQRQGVCREDLWPYLDGVRGNPHAGAVESRYANRIATYSRVPCVPSALKEAMYWHGPALITVDVDGGFASTGGDGRIRSAGLSLGPHAVVACGWDDERGALRIRNSWGTGWGDKGDAWLPYSWAILEAWSCTPALGTPPPEIPWWERLFPFWTF